LEKSPCTPKTLIIAKNCVFCREILRNPCRKRSFRPYRFFASFFQRKKRGSKGQRPLGGGTRSQHRRGSAPATPARGIFEKIPLHPKNFWNSKKLRFLQGDPEKPLPKTQFSAISLLCFFLSKKEAGFQGAAPLGRRTRLKHAGALPLPPRRGGFLKKSPCTPKTLRIAKNCVFCREILRKPCRKRSFRLYRFFAPFFQRKERGSKGRRPLGGAPAY